MKGTVYEKVVFRIGKILKRKSSLADFNKYGIKGGKEDAKVFQELRKFLQKNYSFCYEFEIGDNKIGCFGLKILLEGLEKNDHITSIVFGNCSFGLEEIKMLVKFLGKKKGINIIGLGGNNLCDKSMKLLCDCLKSYDSLEDLCLGVNNFCDEAWKSLGGLLGGNKKIGIVNLAGCEMNDAKLKLMMENGLSKAKNLKVFNLSNNKLTDVSCKFVMELIKNNRMTRFNIERNNFSHDEVKKMKKDSMNFIISEFVLKEQNESLEEKVRYLLLDLAKVKEELKITKTKLDDAQNSKKRYIKRKNKIIEEKDIIIWSLEKKKGILNIDLQKNDSKEDLEKLKERIDEAIESLQEKKNEVKEKLKTVK